MLPLLVSADRDTVMMRHTLAGTTEAATANFADVVDNIVGVNEGRGFLLIGGDASVTHEKNELIEQDPANGERFGIPVAFLVLLVLLDGLVATLIPSGVYIMTAPARGWKYRTMEPGYCLVSLVGPLTCASIVK